MLLNDFKNKHKDEDIYVLASGPSIQFIEPDFFKNKITIGINQIYKYFIPNYLVRKEHKLLNEVLNITKDNNVIHFVSEGDCGGKNITNLKYIQTNFKDNNNIVVYKHNKNQNRLPNELPNDGLVVSWSTITTGIHLAAYMGAKNIILVGHDCGTLDKKANLNNYHTNKTYKIAHINGEKDYCIWLKKIESQTIDLKTRLKKLNGCNIYSLNPFINFGLEGHIYTK
jgi:hypothetical protein